MIARLLAFLAVLYGLGFALFAVTLGAPADPDTAKVDASVHPPHPGGSWRRMARPASSHRITPSTDRREPP